MNNPCPVGQVVTSFSTGSTDFGKPNCVFSSLLPGTFGDTVYYNGTSWTGSNVIYNDAINVGIGLGGLAPQAKLDVG